MSEVQLNEISKLNNELVTAQRDLALKNSRLQRALEELEASRAEIARQRDDIVRMNQELLRSNDDLEQFAYIVSHDIQAPLRAIHGFANLLEERYKSKLDAKADQWIDHIVTGVAQMRHFVNDTLTLARVGATVTREPVDLGGILRRQVERFQGELVPLGGEITWGALPTVMGDPTRIEQLLQNLIQNAIHYRSTAPVRINVAAEATEGFWRVSVHDNGRGIATEHQQIIFEPLRRVSPNHGVAGTGLGLAICKKIVVSHGGRLWVESEIGSGSTFFFTLPV